MPPEPARGVVVDARADVYALGVTLVLLTTGALPGAAGPLRASTTALLLQARPDDRFDDMAAQAEALRALAV